MKIELNNNASFTVVAVVVVVAVAFVFTQFASCTARSNEAAAHQAADVKIHGNTILTIKP